MYGGGQVGDKLVHQDIDLICFTGSSKTGKYLYKVAAEKFIKVLLELGGSAPGVVFEDVDIDMVLDTIYANRFDNCGQICDGLKRLIVHEKVYKKVVEALVVKLEKAKVGDALDKDTDIGPLVSARQFEILVDQVSDAKRKGSKILVGGKKLDNLPGYFYSPTLLTNVKPNMRVWREEVFGPVLPIVTFKIEEEAIKLANDTEYGLGGYVFTEDTRRFERVSKEIETGMVQMNNASYLSPSTPFGGCKISGMGREHGKFGFHEVTQIKTLSVEK